MKTTSPENRREFWKNHSAVIAFQGAKRLALKLQEMTLNDDLFYDLTLAMHVLYARPFKHQEKTLRLPASCVPNSHLIYHEMLIYGRDKIFAHHDRKATKITDQDSDEFSSLVITFQEGNMYAKEMFPYLHPGELPKVTELCTILMKFCTLNLSVLASRCLDPSIYQADGMFIVSSSFEGEAPLLKKKT